MSSRRERKKTQTKRGIVRAARALIVQQGLAATTMAAVAERADVATGTLYNYFPSKDALLLGIWSEATQDALALADNRVAQAGDDPLARCSALLVLYAEAVKLFDRPTMREVFSATLAAGAGELAADEPGHGGVRARQTNASEASAIEAGEFSSLDGQLMQRLAVMLMQFKQEGVLLSSISIETATNLLYSIATNHFMSYVYMPEVSFEATVTSIEAQVDMVFRGIATKTSLTPNHHRASKAAAKTGERT